MAIEPIKTRLTADTAGTATGTARCYGKIAGIEIINSAAPTEPTGGWKFQLKTEKGSQIYYNGSVSTASNTFTIPAFGTYFEHPVAGTLNLTGTAMGSTSVADVIFYIEQ